jgi:tRNA(fMet)-specific endonuclease VapC
MRYLLDTNTLSDLIRNPQGKIANRIAQVGEDAVCTSIIVAAELRFGAAKSESSKLQSRVELVLALLKVLPLEAPVDVHYADIRKHLSRLGTPIGPNDLFIAAHARALDICVVTGNVSEFARVPGLSVQNWLG